MATKRICQIMPRMEQYYFKTLAPDLMVMTYDHNSSYHSESVVLQEKPTLYTVMSKPLISLPTVSSSNSPVTNLLSIVPKTKKAVFIKERISIIDGLKPSIKEEKEVKLRPYIPEHRYIPALKRIKLRIFTNEAITKK